MWHRPCCLLVLLAGICVAPLLGEDKASPPPAAAKPAEKPAGTETLSSILEAETLRTFQAVENYARSHQSAADIDTAYLWLFQNGVNLKREVEVLPHTEAYLARKNPNPQLKAIAQQVRALGLVKQGEGRKAVEVLEAMLETGRFRNSNQIVEFASILANKVQATGNIEATRIIFEKLGEAFPLNEDLLKLTKRKLDRLDLIGQPPPSLIKGKDWEGKALNLEDYKGKVLLIDFWATNCPPCLAEIPNLKRLYERFHPQGFEILGISLDEDQSRPEELRDRAELKWRMAMNKVADGELCEPYAVPTIPALFLVNQAGNVVHVDLTGEELRGAIERLLKAPATTKPAQEKPAPEKSAPMKPAPASPAPPKTP